MTRVMVRKAAAAENQQPANPAKNRPGLRWMAGIKKYEDLPENCRNYIEFIEEQIGYPITMVSNGPERHDIIYRESELSK